MEIVPQAILGDGLQKFLKSTRFSSLSHTFVCKLANLLLMDSRFLRMNMEDLLIFSIGKTANNGKIISINGEAVQTQYSTKKIFPEKLKSI